jgi:hypothetical protein
VVHYSVGPTITIHGRITAREYVDRLGYQVHPKIQTLFPNNDAVLQHEKANIHTAGTVQPLFEEHERELQHLPWPAQSSDLNITESLLVSFGDKSEEQIPTSNISKALEVVLQEEWYEIPLETLQNLYESVGFFVGVTNVGFGLSPM